MIVLHWQCKDPLRQLNCSSLYLFWPDLDLHKSLNTKIFSVGAFILLMQLKILLFGYLISEEMSVYSYVSLS